LLQVGKKECDSSPQRERLNFAKPHRSSRDSAPQRERLSCAKPHHCSRVISPTRKCESKDCQQAHTPNARSRSSQSIISHQCVIVWSLAKRGAGANTKVVSEVEDIVSRKLSSTHPHRTARSSDISRASRASWFGR
jgi:hypothetical protein